MPTSVAVIGAGSVGATAACAYACVLGGVGAEVIMVDVMPEVAKGQVLDLSDASFVKGVDVKFGTLQDAGQASIIVVTAGARQKEGETRIDLIGRNKAILKSVFEGMQPINPNAIVILVANPVDILTSIAQNLSGLPRNQVFGSGTFLDTERLRVALSDALDVSESSVHAFVLGEHGDSQIVAWSSGTIGGTPLLEIPEVQKMDRDAVAKAVANKAYDIIKAKGGACVAQLCQAIIQNHKSVKPLSVYVEKYGTCISVPCVLGAKGIERILEVPLSKEEEAGLLKSVATLKEVLSKFS
ncbi:lactate dehydrogenase A [Hyaloraphidium curvatum]|nr:lactate dehydrogenase A [Hyaloraphidium curvatum]